MSQGTTTAISSEKHSQDASSKDDGPPVAVQSSPDPNHEYLSGLKLVAVLAAVVLPYFLVMLDASIVSTAAPQITTTFNSLLDVGWYGAAYELTSSASQPLSGKIYTKFSLKWSYLAFFVLFELGSVICGAAHSSIMLIVGRALAGLGSSGLLNGGLTILSSVLVPAKQPGFMGVLVALGQLGIACGPLVGGAFTEYVTWRWCFYINLPVGGVAALLLIFVAVPENHPKPPVRETIRNIEQALDLIGFAIILPTAIMFFMALEWGGQRYAWSSSVVIGLFVGAGVSFILFLVWEYYRGDDAMLPFSMLRTRIVCSAAAYMFFFFGVLFCFDYYLPIFFQSVEDDTAFLSGVHMLPQVIAQVVFAMVSGVMVQNTGYYLPWIVGGSMFATIGYGLLSSLSPSTSNSRRIGYQVLFGIGIGSATTTPFIAVQGLVSPAQIPVAMGIVIFTQNLGGAIWVAVAQAIFDNSLYQAIGTYAPGVNPNTLLEAGVRSIRSLVSKGDLPGVLRAYAKSVNHVFYLGTALAGISFLISFSLGWTDIRKKEASQEIKKTDTTTPSDTV